MKIYALGIDLGKTVFHLVGLDSSGQVVVRKRCSRTQLLAFTGNLQVQLIGMEASSGAHFLGKALRAQGHDVRLMPAQYVKPYVKTNKSDYIDSEAIAEAVQRPRMRFVPIKTEEQLDLQALHRVRERWVMRRTAVVNQIRSVLHAASCCICSLMDSCASETLASWPTADAPHACRFAFTCSARNQIHQPNKTPPPPMTPPIFGAAPSVMAQ